MQCILYYILCTYVQRTEAPPPPYFRMPDLCRTSRIRQDRPKINQRVFCLHMDHWSRRLHATQEMVSLAFIQEIIRPAFIQEMIRPAFTQEMIRPSRKWLERLSYRTRLLRLSYRKWLFRFSFRKWLDRLSYRKWSAWLSYRKSLDCKREKKKLLFQISTSSNQRKFT